MVDVLQSRRLLTLRSHRGLRWTRGRKNRCGGRGVRGAVLGRDDAASFGFGTGEELSVGAVGGELGVRDGCGGLGVSGMTTGWRGGGRRLWLRRGKAGFAGELQFFVRGGAAFFAVHMRDGPFG